MRTRQANFDDRSIPPRERRGAQRSAQPAEPLLDAHARAWPVVPVPQGPSISALEDTIAKQSDELNLRCTQVADLYNLQQRQANELQLACEEIDRLSATIANLVEKTAQQEDEAEAARKQITVLNDEKATLRSRLETALAEARDAAHRLLVVETAFNDCETTLASALEKIDSLNSELISASADTFKVVAVTTGEKQRYRSELNQQKTSYESRIKALEVAAAVQDSQVKTLEDARTKLARRVEILETLRASEREAAEFRIKVLTEDLQRERLGFSNEQRAFAALRHEKASDSFVPHNSAA
jgi:chromosome segregation ATPase